MPETNTAPIALTVTRRFDASAEQVFDAWLDPVALGRWLFATPTGVMQKVEVEPRVGGRFVINEQRGEMLAEHFGTYLAIERPTRLVLSFATDRVHPPTRVTVTIKPLDQACELTLTHELDPQWAAFEDKARQGWTMILGSLANVLRDAESERTS